MSTRLLRRPHALLLASLAAAGIIGLLAAWAERADSAPAEQGPLYGVLLGKNEISTDGRTRAGDRDGRASASAITDDGRLCFGLTVKNVDKPVAAHIHRGTRGRNGPVVVTLVAPQSGDPGASSGCVAVADHIANALKKNPHKYYWNLHSEAFPGGAVRGQVFARTR